MRFILFPLVIFSILLTGVATSLASDAAKGEILYNSNCAVCHGFYGAGLKGPALVGVIDRLGEEGTKEVILKGRLTMPAWGKSLGEKDVEYIVSYLKTIKGTEPAPGSSLPWFWGLVVALIVVGGMFFFLRKPSSEK